MSVFIQINEAIISEDAVPGRIAIAIKSRDTTLAIEPIPAFPSTTINRSLISSIKEKQLQFVLTPINQKGEPLYNLSCQLSFSPLYFSAEKEVDQNLCFGINVKLSVNIFFTKKKNYLGPIEFYQYKNQANSSIIAPVVQAAVSNSIPIIPLQTKKQLSSSKQIQEYPVSLSDGKIFAKDEKKEKPKKGFFFCCGGENDEKNYEVQDFDERGGYKASEGNEDASFPKQLKKGSGGEDVQFYKGPCKTKNVFSLCDAPVNDNKYTVIQSHYKDKNP